jgi:hypothetical protein
MNSLANNFKGLTMSDQEFYNFLKNWLLYINPQLVPSDSIYGIEDQIRKNVMECGHIGGTFLREQLTKSR